MASGIYSSPTGRSLPGFANPSEYTREGNMPTVGINGYAD
jgi:hypothetical protein